MAVAKKTIYDAAVKNRKLRKDVPELTFDSAANPERSQAHMNNVRNYLHRLGADSGSPPFFANGAALPRNDGWLQAMSSKVDMDLRLIQQQVFEETISDDAWIAGHFLKNAVSKRNPYIVPEDENAIKIIDMALLMRSHQEVFERLPRVASEPSTGFPVQLILVGNLDSAQGLKAAVEAVEFTRSHRSVELILLHNPTSTASMPNSIRLLT